MSIDSNNLNMMINYTVQNDSVDKNNDDVHFKNMSKHKKFSNFSTELTKEN